MTTGHYSYCGVASKAGKAGTRVAAAAVAAGLAINVHECECLGFRRRSDGASGLVFQLLAVANHVGREVLAIHALAGNAAAVARFEVATVPHA